MAKDISAKKSNFISRCVAGAVALKAARDTLANLDDEFVKFNYAQAIGDDDFVDGNKHLDAATLTALFTTQGNLETFWGAGNGTNVDKVVP